MIWSMRKLSREKRAMILSALVEGNSVNGSHSGHHGGGFPACTRFQSLVSGVSVGIVVPHAHAHANSGVSREIRGRG